MHDVVRQFVSNCAQSKIGRFVFVSYLVYSICMIGYFYGHLGDLYPFRFYGERELFMLLNLPQITLIRSSRLLYQWQASKFNDAVSAVYIALPWWVYGYVFELIVKRIADKTPAEYQVDRRVDEYSRSLTEAHICALPSTGLVTRLRESFDRSVR